VGLTSAILDWRTCVFPFVISVVISASVAFFATTELTIATIYGRSLIIIQPIVVYFIFLFIRSSVFINRFRTSAVTNNVLLVALEPLPARISTGNFEWKALQTFPAKQTERLAAALDVFVSTSMAGLAVTVLWSAYIGPVGLPLFVMGVARVLAILASCGYLWPLLPSIIHSPKHAEVYSGFRGRRIPWSRLQVSAVNPGTHELSEVVIAVFELPFARPLIVPSFRSNLVEALFRLRAGSLPSPD
jgi:hypothetical protein